MLIDEIKECSKCGICRSVCPVFAEINHEVMSPRGRISLVEAMLENGLTLSERYVDTVKSCIKCTRCANICPSGVRPEKVVQSAREMLYGSMGIPERVKETFRLIFNQDQFRKYLLNNNLSEPADKPPLWQLPLMFHGRAYLPNLAEKTALESHSEYINAGGKHKVALFLGCSINYSNIHLADSVIDVLKKLGVSVFLPKDQVCCGAPMLFHGDMQTARDIAIHNMKSVNYVDFDAVVTLCPACCVTLKQEYQRIVDENIDDFTSKVLDISEFIDKYTEYQANKKDMLVTYHDPCYLRFGQNISDEPRRILKEITNYIEMKDAGKCCGLGGTLAFFHPEVSGKIGEKKVQSIIQSGADVIATGCPGCILFIKDQLNKRGIRKDVLHTIQIFQRSL